MSEGNDHISEEELRDRVIYALFLPAVRLARVFGVKLSVMKEWLEMAYFHELRREDMKGKEAAEVMGVSASKISLLARQLKGNFMRPEHEEELVRRIEFVLWVEPLSRAKLVQVLPGVSGKAINAALKEMMEEGRVRRVKRGTVMCYELVIQTDRRAWDSWLARIDGLQDALGTVSNVVYGRFFKSDDRAFARTLAFRIARGDLAELVQMYEQAIIARIIELDARTKDLEESEVEEMSISLFWGPYEYIKRLLEQERAEQVDREP